MASLSLPSPRAARTRAALIAAGFELLAERPIDAIPIDDFVARASVGKGSFFNHFIDKQDFAEAIAAEVRLELETWVVRANEGIADPVERIARGMHVCADFALSQPTRTIILLRSQASSTLRAYSLNRGLVEDFDAACAQGLLRNEARDAGMVYWLGLCQILMTNLIERKRSAAEANQRVKSLVLLGLSGLGITDDQAARLSAIE